MPTESLHKEIRRAIPSIINMLGDLYSCPQHSAASALAELAKHGKQ